jgi:DNA-binding Lrp family transcriptional regulator
VLGRPLRLVVNVILERERIALVDAFKQAIRAAPEVVECYHVTGRPDFVLVVLVRDMGDYERFCREHIMSNDNVREFESLVVMETQHRHSAGRRPRATPPSGRPGQRPLPRSRTCGLRQSAYRRNRR